MGRGAVVATVATASLVALTTTVWPLASYRSQTAVACLGAILTLHGLGRALTWRDPGAAPAQVIALGLAGYLAVGGWLAAASALTQPVVLAIGALGLVAGLGWLATARPRWTPPRAPLTLGVLALAAAIAVVAVLAAAGAPGEFTDGDGLLRGAVARLAQTGALDDGVGLPRHLGLGGSTVVLSLGVALPDDAALHAIDRGLGLGLVIALLAPRAAATSLGSYGALAVVALVLGVPPMPPDLAPVWMTVALLIALHDALAVEAADGAAPGPRTALLAAGLASLGHAGLAVVAVVAVLAARRQRWSSVAVAVLGVSGYLVAAATASGLVVPAPSPGRVAAGLAIAIAVWAMTGVLARALAAPGLARWQVALAAALGGGVAIAPTAGLVVAAVGPYAIALVLVWTARALAAGEGRRFLVVAIAFVLVLVPAGLRFRLGVPARTWGDRWADELDALRATAAPAAPRAAAASYRAAQAAIPRGSRVAVWVEAAELLDYRRHDIVDLRSAAAAACHGRRQRLDHPGPRRCRGLAARRGTLAADYLIVSPSAALPPDDPLARRVAAGARVATTSDLVVVALAPGPP